MDNQDANKEKGGLITISKNILEGKIGPNEKVKKLTDSSGQMTDANVVVQPDSYVNVQSRSMVETTREEASKELEEIKAFNKELERQEHLQENKNKAKHVIVFTLLGIFGAIILVVLGWMAYNTFIAVRPIAPPEEKEEGGSETKYDTVDGYQCETTNCYKAAELPDGRILIRDTDFYVYNTEEKKAVLTTIENQEYHEIRPFTWGGKPYLVLDPESSKSGLFSIDDNGLTVSFKYDSFYTDINDDVYREMKDAEGQYIVAKLGNYYRLVRLYDGQEMISGAERVFVHGEFYVSFEQNGERRLYDNSGHQIKVIASGNHLYINGAYAVDVKPTNAKSYTFTIYSSNGETVRKGEMYNYIRNIKIKDLVTTLDSNKSYYKVFTQ